MAALYGWDPIRYASASDTHRVFADAVLERMVALDEERMRNQAVLIANEVARLFGGS